MFFPLSAAAPLGDEINGMQVRENTSSAVKHQPFSVHLISSMSLYKHYTVAHEGPVGGSLLQVFCTSFLAN